MKLPQWIKTYLKNTQLILHSYNNPLKQTENEQKKNTLEREFYDNEAQQYLTDFDKDFFRYDPHEEYPPSFRRFYTIIAEKAPGKRVLDCGSGDGFTSVKSAKHGAIAYGVDVAPEMIRLAKKHAAFNNVEKQTNFNLMSAENLAFKDATFDIIAGASSLHHLNLQRAGAELARVLKPGGIALFVEPRIPFKGLIFLRSLFPTKCYESPGGSQLSDADVSIFARHFTTIHTEYFSVFAKLSRLPGFKRLTPKSEKVDTYLLKKIPALRHASWSFVLVFTK